MKLWSFGLHILTFPSSQNRFPNPTFHPQNGSSCSTFLLITNHILRTNPQPILVFFLDLRMLTSLLSFKPFFSHSTSSWLILIIFSRRLNCLMLQSSMGLKVLWMVKFFVLSFLMWIRLKSVLITLTGND